MEKAVRVEVFSWAKWSDRCHAHFRAKQVEAFLIPNEALFWKKCPCTFHELCGSFGEETVFSGRHGQWVGSGGSVICPELLRTACSLGPLGSASLIEVENFWLLNGSCECWKIKGFAWTSGLAEGLWGWERQWKKMFVLQLPILHTVVQCPGREGWQGEKKSPSVFTQNLLSSWDFWKKLLGVCQLHLTPIVAALLQSQAFNGSLRPTPLLLDICLLTYCTWLQPSVSNSSSIMLLGGFFGGFFCTEMVADSSQRQSHVESIKA